MAIVRHLAKQALERDSQHTETECTYSIVRNDSAEVFLQVDTYGSAQRRIAGKKSQSIRFSREALIELEQIIGQCL